MLLESESGYRALLERVPAVIYVERSLGNDRGAFQVVFVSSEVQTLLGYTVDEWRADPKLWASLVHPDDLERVLAQSEAAEAAQGAFRSVYRLLTRDGRLLWIQDEARPLPSESGAPPLWCGVIVDVTERKQAEEALRESDEQFRLAAAASGTAVYAWDLQTDLTTWVSGLDTLGYARQELAQSSDWFEERIHPGDRERREEADREMYAGRLSGFTLEYRLKGADGLYRTVLDRAHVFHDTEGRPVRAIGAITDLSDLRRAEAERRESEERFRAIVETTEDWIWEADTEGRLTYSNPAVERILGYRSDELLGRNGFELMHEEDREALEERFLACAAEGRGWSRIVSRMQHRDGAYRYLESSGLPVLTQAGEVTGYRGTDRDVTERVQAEHLREQLEEKLGQAQKLEAIGRLAGGIAHDFNNLLTAITGYSELLLARLSADDPRRAEAQEIAAAAERAASLIRRLLAFARKQVLRPELLDLNAVVLETESMLRRIVGEGVELLLDLHSGAGRVRADRGQLEQVILDLAANARDAMPDGGRLSIETGGAEIGAQEAAARGLAQGRYALLVVADTGIGIDAETRPRLFEPFFTTKELGEGAGLGLAAAHGIVAQTGGHVELESERGRGTTLRVYLPSAEEETEEKDGGEAHAAGAGETILLVEDEEVVRGLSRRVLAASGYTILEAGAGEEALELAARYEGTIDLVLTDVVMPGMRGPELVSRLRSARPGIRVVLTSGYTGENVVPNGPGHEGTAFLEKPFAPQALLRKVREVLDRDEP